MMPRSWQNPDDPLYKLLQGCGEPVGWWVKNALEFLPSHIRRESERKLAFYSNTKRDSCRVSREICAEREIILLSERITPSEKVEWSDPAVRYFVFVVLHEIAHAIQKHRPPYELSSTDNDAQEAEAHDLALNWFNERAKMYNWNPLNMEEIQSVMARNRGAMKDLVEG